MIVSCPCNRRGAAAALVLSDHIVSIPDAVRHHSSHYLLHPAIRHVVAVGLITQPAYAHAPPLGVIGEGPGSVPGHVAARIVNESRLVHTRYAVRLYSRRLPDHDILQLIAATYRVPHSRPVP